MSRIALTTDAPAPSARTPRAASTAFLHIVVASVLVASIVAVACTLGADHASAAALDVVPDNAGGRLTMGGMLLGMFGAMCALTTTMLRRSRPERARVQVRTSRLG